MGRGFTVHLLLRRFAVDCRGLPVLPESPPVPASGALRPKNDDAVTGVAGSLFCDAAAAALRAALERLWAMRPLLRATFAAFCAAAVSFSFSTVSAWLLTELTSAFCASSSSTVARALVAAVVVWAAAPTC